MGERTCGDHAKYRFTPSSLPGRFRETITCTVRQRTCAEISSGENCLFRAGTTILTLPLLSFATEYGISCERKGSM